jgi:hypothetical protein
MQVMLRAHRSLTHVCLERESVYASVRALPVGACCAAARSAAQRREGRGALRAALLGGVLARLALALVHRHLALLVLRQVDEVRDARGGRHEAHWRHQESAQSRAHTPSALQRAR